MAKKFGKLLLFTAAIGAAAAGTYYCLQNKNQKPAGEDDDYDDLDDFESDYDDDEEEDADEAGRSYVSLNLDGSKEKVEEFFDDDETAEETQQKAEAVKQGVAEPEKGAVHAAVEAKEEDDDDDPDPSLDAM